MSPRPLGLGMGWWRSSARSRLVTAGHDGAGCVTVVTVPSHRVLASTARLAGVARSRNPRLRNRRAIALCGTSRYVRLIRSPPPRLRLRRCNGDSPPRPRGRVVDPKCLKATSARCRAVVPRSNRHQDRALAAARRLGNKPSRSPPPRLLRSEPDSAASSAVHCAAKL